MNEHESIDARFYTFPWPDVLALNIIDNPEDRLPFLAAIFGLTRPMLVAMTNNPMIPRPGRRRSTCCWRR
jgi:hypothetical protein